MNEAGAPEAGKDSNPAPEDFAHGVGYSLSPKEECKAKGLSQKMFYSSRTVKQATARFKHLLVD